MRRIAKIWDLKSFNYDNADDVAEVSRTLGITRQQSEMLLAYMHASIDDVLLDDLLQVPGIGPRTKEKLRDFFYARTVKKADPQVLARIHADAARKRRLQAKRARGQARREFGLTLGEALGR